MKRLRNPDYDLGPCCACGRDDDTVRNILMLPRRAPVPGTGWGCLVCGLPSDGATTVLCDECLDRNAEPREVIYGYATDKKRLSLADLSPYSFEHDESKHEGEEAL